MFEPFKPDPEWYDKHWNAEKLAKSPWAFGGTISLLATILMAAWIGW